MDAVKAPHNRHSINASYYDYFLHLFLFILLVSMDDSCGGEQEGGESKEKQLKRSLGKQLCRQALHWISI